MTVLDPALAVELDSEDVAIQLHVAGHRRIINVESERFRDLDRLLGDLLGIVGDAVEGAEIVAVIEQAPDFLDIVVPVGEQLGAKFATPSHAGFR